jgi:dihydroorotase
LKTISIRQPDDWHVHLRDEPIMDLIIQETSQIYGRAIVMPNLIPPIINQKDALNYKKRIMALIPDTHNFLPLMTIYLTQNTTKEEIQKSYLNGDVFAAKLYPAGATTNSEFGVNEILKIIPLLEYMAKIGMPLLIHGESTDPDIDIFDREKVFIDNTLVKIRRKIPDLKITLEHITTKNAVDYVTESGPNLGASITPHHLTLNRNHMLAKGIRPHYYCLPVLKREVHRLALVEAAVSGKKNFFLGTDSAPHEISTKENSCGCAGVFHSSKSLPMLAQIFEEHNALDKLEPFVSLNGAMHYGLKPNKRKIELMKKSSPVHFIKEIYNSTTKIKSFIPPFEVYWDVINKN